MSHLTQSLIEIISTYQANTGWSQWVFQPWDVLADRMFQSNWSLLKHKEEHKDKNSEVLKVFTNISFESYIMQHYLFLLTC